MVVPSVIFGIAGAYYVYDEYQELKAIPEDLALSLEESGEAFISRTSDFVSNIDWEQVGLFVGNIAAEVITATQSAFLGIIRGIGPAMIEGAQTFYGEVAQLLEDRQAEVISGFTVGLLVIVTLLYLYGEVMRGAP